MQSRKSLPCRNTISTKTRKKHFYCFPGSQCPKTIGTKARMSNWRQNWNADAERGGGPGTSPAASISASWGPPRREDHRGHAMILRKIFYGLCLSAFVFPAAGVAQIRRTVEPLPEIKTRLILE